ncbi:MAG TPA: DUF362 domain-containing protein [Vicinamibacteria bacterium]|nr:DUF362 domain-containing protein [Vicinamibacteria bacterium]
MTSEPAARAIVALERAQGDVTAAVRRALETVEWTRAVPKGKDVALKVNLGWDLFIPGSITSPLFAEALIQAIRGHVGAIYVVESDQVLEDVERAFHESGMADVCRRTGATWINMTRGSAAPREEPANVVLKRIEVPRILKEAVLITVPVLKTHAKTRISGALKNQWGCIGTMRHEYHLVLDDALADLNHVLRPALAVMDGTVGLEGDGPKSGWPRVADVVLCSRDPVAIDAVEAMVMGIDPASVGHLATCAARGIGVADPARIEIRGAPLADVRQGFRTARHNPVSLVETLLRKSFLKRLFFNTPIFGVCLWGAKLYYRQWARRNRRRALAEVLAHPVYGPQWRGVRA